MSALMTHQNNPRVSIVKGNVTTFRQKPMVPFTRPITTAANRAEPNPLMSKPFDDIRDDEQTYGAQQPSHEKISHPSTAPKINNGDRSRKIIIA